MLTQKIHPELRTKVINNDKIRLTDSNSDLEMFSYLKCDEDDNEFLKQCRGLIFNNKKLIAPSFGWTAEYTKDDKEIINTLLDNKENNIRIFDSYEGCLLRVYYFNGKWHISTHRRLDAFHSRWASKKYWGEIFTDSLEQEYDEFLDLLDKTKIYFFVVRNNKENRIVCNVPEKNKVLHVGTMYKNNEQWITSFDEDINIPHPKEFKLINNNSVDEIVSYVEQAGYENIQGVIIFTNTKIFKVCNKKYYDFLQARGNEASINFRYLQIRMDKSKRERLLFLYPEYAKSFELYETCIFKSALSLIKAYVMRFVRGQWKQVPKDEYEGIIRPLREWYLEDQANNKITLEIIIDKLNNQKAQFLNRLVKRMILGETRNNTFKLEQKRLLKPGFEKQQV